MANGNGNGWTKWLVGTLWSVVMAVILFMGNVVKANDIKATEEHKSIREEFREADQKIIDKVAQDIKEIQRDQTTMLVQQTKILTILKEIKAE